MFQLEQHDAQFASLNTRIQKHGADRVLAADLAMTVNAPNTILETIEPGLRTSLFRKPGKGDQMDFDHDQKAQAAQITDQLVAVRHPGFGPLQVAHKFPGYELVILDAFEDSTVEPIVLVDLTMKKLTIQPIEGGSVLLSFTVSGEVTNDDVAELCDALVREDVRLTLTPPKAHAQHDEEEQKEAA